MMISFLRLLVTASILVSLNVPAQAMDPKHKGDGDKPGGPSRKSPARDDGAKAGADAAAAAADQGASASASAADGGAERKRKYLAAADADEAAAAAAAAAVDCNLDTMPVVVITNIAKYLSRRERHSLFNTTRGLRFAVTAGVRLENLPIITLGHESIFENMRNTRLPMPRLRILHLVPSTQLPVGCEIRQIMLEGDRLDISNLAPLLPGLRSLNLKNTKSVIIPPDDLGKNEVMHYPLESLAVQASSVLPRPAIVSLLTIFNEVTNLNLARCGQVDDEVVSNLVRLLPALEELDLGGCAALNKEGLRLVATQLPELRTLHLGGCQAATTKAAFGGFLPNGAFPELPAEAIPALPANVFPALRNLTLAGCSGVTDEVLKLLAQRPLSILNLWGCRAITDVGVRSLADPASASHITLTDLNLSDIGAAITSAVLPDLASLPKLESLDMSYTGVDNVQRLAGARSLTTLRLAGAVRLSNLLALAGIRTLKTLELTLMNHSSQDLAALQRANPQLRVRM